MARVDLTLAMTDYDHTRDFALGVVQAEGIELNYLDLPLEEIFYRFTRFREWEVSEMSFAKYVATVSQPDSPLTAIPVFPSRMFRQSSIYVRSDGPVQRVEDLAGRRVGIPEWAQTASVYTRGYLVHQVGIPLQDIDWVQAGVNQPGRREKVNLRLPQGVRYTSMPERNLSEMLLAGDIDAAMSARPLAPFQQGHPNVRRLFEDFRSVEEEYWRQTGVFPIMHTVALRTDVVERHPWVPMNLLKAFEEARRRSIDRALDTTASRFPIPWGFVHAAAAREMFGKDLWPYGIEPNRTTLTTFLQYAYEQGVCHRPLQVEELFPREVQSVYAV